MNHEMTNRNDGNSSYQERLRRAVRSDSNDPPPFLEAKIRASLQQEKSSRPTAWFRFPTYWKLAAAACTIILVAGIAYQLRTKAEDQESYIASVSNRVATLMRVGLGDHIHCTVFRKPVATPPPVEKFVQDLGPQYAGLIPVVRESVPAKYRMTLAHQCSYRKRKFVHLSLAGDGKLISLVIARKQDGESFKTEGFLPSLVRSGIPVYQAGVDKFSMNAFESRDYLVYVVSDLPGTRNQEMMVALAEPVRHFLNQLEL